MSLRSCAAGAEGHQSVFGRDLLSEAPTREYVVCETVGGRMVRFGEHKYIRIEDDDRREEILYNLADDPGESRDLAGEASAASALTRGRGYLEDYYRRVGADISTTRRWRRELFEPST